MSFRTKLIKLLEEPKAIFASRGVKRSHDYLLLNAIRLYGRDFKTFIDIGANKGLFLNAASIRIPKSKKIAFEPIYENYLKCTKKAEAYNIGLWNKNGTKVLNIHKNSGDSSFYERKDKRRPPKEKRKTKLLRFDKLDIPIKRPCLVKIDVEGSEYKVLEGFGKRIQEVDAFIIERHFSSTFKNNEPFWKMLKILEESGFKELKQVNLRSDGKRLTHSNFIFIKRS